MVVEEVSKVNHLPPDTAVRASVAGWLLPKITHCVIS